MFFIYRTSQCLFVAASIVATLLLIAAATQSESDGDLVQHVTRWPDGVRQSEYSVDDNGELHGTARYYDEQGNLRIQTVYSHGEWLSHKEFDALGVMTKDKSSGFW